MQKSFTAEKINLIHSFKDKKDKPLHNLYYRETLSALVKYQIR